MPQRRGPNERIYRLWQRITAIPVLERSNRLLIQFESRYPHIIPCTPSVLLELLHRCDPDIDRRIEDAYGVTDGPNPRHSAGREWYRDARTRARSMREINPDLPPLPSLGLDPTDGLGEMREWADMADRIERGIEPPHGTTPINPVVEWGNQPPLMPAEIQALKKLAEREQGPSSKSPKGKREKAGRKPPKGPVGRRLITGEDADKRQSFYKEVLDRKAQNDTPMKEVAHDWGLDYNIAKAWVEWCRDRERTAVGCADN